MRGRVREAGDGAWPCEAEAEKGEIGGDEVRGLSWAEGGEESFQTEGRVCLASRRVVWWDRDQGHAGVKGHDRNSLLPQVQRKVTAGIRGWGEDGGGRDVPLPIRPGKPSQEDERAVDDASVSLSRHPCTRSNY